MFSKRLSSLTPYVPGEQPQDRRYIKLNTNENPYPPSPAIARLLREVDPELLRRYPDPQFTALRAAIGSQLALSPDRIFAGNGSDEILSFVFYAFFDSTRGPLLFPGHTYSFYPVYGDFYGITYQRVPLEADFSIRLAAYLDIPSSCGVIFPNPNAPTGMGIGIDAVADFMGRYPADRVVVIDEAYVDFGAESAVALLDRFDNLLVVRTLSKSMALAGLRLGYALGSPALIEALFTVKDSFNSYPLDALSQQIGMTAMADTDYFADITRRIIVTREAFADGLRELGWQVLPSSANFVFAASPDHSGRDVYEGLKARGILVRYFDVDGLRGHVRITIGTDKEMERLLEVIGGGF